MSADRPKIGSIGLSHPPRGFAGWPGRAIAFMQGLRAHDARLPGGVKTVREISHIRTLTAHDTVTELTWPRWKPSTWEETIAATPGGIVWFEPPEALTGIERAKLASDAQVLCDAGAKYGILTLLRAAVLGHLGPGGYVCTSGAALLRLRSTGDDVSGCSQPYAVDLRDWLVYLNAAGWTRWDPPA